MAKLSIKDLSIKGQRVFIRVDFNVPLKNGVIGDDTRIRASLPTIQYALDQGASTIVLASHLGRPKGKPNPEFSLKPVAERLSQLLGQAVAFGLPSEPSAKGGRVTLLENLRFDPREEKNDAEFARLLAAHAPDLYVDDAFGAAHRAHASVEAITRCYPKAAAGLLMEQELRYLGHVLEAPERPFVLIIGGAMAYTFFKSQGIPVGKSLVEEDKLDAARKIEADAADKRVMLALPVDHVVADTLDANAATELLKVGDPAIGDRMGLDIGPDTIRKYESLLADAKTVVWNGPMGVFEIDKFAAGTNAVAKAVAAVKGTTVIGGGDSIAAIKKAKMADRVTHISTGGGASLEFLGGRTLPGVAALTDK